MAKEKIIKNSDKKEKKDLWVKFRTFITGVVSEFKKVHWPSRKDMVKYSVATVVFVLFLSLFFYAIEIVFAFVQTLIK